MSQVTENKGSIYSHLFDDGNSNSSSMSIDESRSSVDQKRNEHSDDSDDSLEDRFARLEGLVEVKPGWIDVIVFEVVGDVNGERGRFGESIGDQFGIIDAESEAVVTENERFLASGCSNRFSSELSARRSSPAVPLRTLAEIIFDSS